MEFSMEKYLNIFKKNIIVCIGIVVTCVGMILFNEFSKKSTVYTSNSLVSYNYAELIKQKSETNISDLMYRKIADYVAIAKSDNFKQKIGLIDRTDIKMEVSLLTNSHVAQIKVTANNEKDVLFFEHIVHKELQHIAATMYQDEFFITYKESVQQVQLKNGQMIKMTLLGIIVGVILSLIYVMIRYSLEKD